MACPSSSQLDAPPKPGRWVVVYKDARGQDRTAMLPPGQGQREFPTRAGAEMWAATRAAVSQWKGYRIMERRF